MVRELDHLNEMLDVKKQIYLCKSWKRRKDLKKYLLRLEQDWYEYQKYKQNASNSKRS